jgi:hypothetical protein
MVVLVYRYWNWCGCVGVVVGIASIGVVLYVAVIVEVV